MSTITNRYLLPILLFTLSCSGILPAQPQMPQGEQQVVHGVYLASPDHYDIFYGIKDRIYLTGVWQFKSQWNFLTRQWIDENLEVGQTFKGKGLMLRPGVAIPDREIELIPEYCRVELDASSWWDLLVPSSWNDLMPYEKKGTRPGWDWHGKNYAMGGIGYYRKTFFLPMEKKGQRLVLHFENIETRCVVWVNGQEVARHENWDPEGNGRVAGAFLDSFDAEITDAVQWGEENTIVVGVYDSGLPLAYFTPDSGGITGLVWIDCHPSAFFSKVLVTAPYEAGELTIDARPFEPSDLPETFTVKLTPWQSKYYQFSADNKQSFQAELKAQPSPRDGYIRLVMPVQGIEPWDIQQPNLYQLTIIDPRNQATMAIERFGIRTVSTTQEHILLNGKPVYFFGMNVGPSILGTTWSHGPALTNKYGYNFHNAGRQFIRAKKESGFSSQRIHTGPNHLNAYYFCDEVGMLVRDEFTPARLIEAIQDTPDFEGTYNLDELVASEGKGFAQDIQEKLQAFIDHAYNSPCIVTWSGGNEMASGVAAYRTYCTLFYQFMHEHDPQHRPITPSSGMHWGRGPNQELAWSPLPADYLDYHSYQVIQGRLMSNVIKSLTREYDELIQKVYKGQIKPTILGEFFAQFNTQERLSVFTPELFNDQGQPKPQDYVALMNDEVLPHQKRFNHRATAWQTATKISVSGIRSQQNRQADSQARGRYLKRVLESVRHECDYLFGYSIHGLNTLWYFTMQSEDTNDFPHFDSYEIQALKKVQQPLIAIPDFWIRNVLAGQTMNFESRVINWSNEDFTGVLKITIVNADGDVAGEYQTSIQNLNISKARDIKVTLPIAPNATAGVYTMQSDLFLDDELLSRNTHRVTVSLPSEFPPIVSKLKIGLHETCEAPQTAAKMLEAFGVEVQPIADLSNLGDYDVLIIGRNSCDQYVFENAGSIRQYLEDGGKMIVFEQQDALMAPWAPSLKFLLSGPAPNADPIHMDSPYLNKLSDQDFVTWGQSRIVHRNLIRPLSEHVIVAGSATGTILGRTPRFGMALAQFRVGKGVFLMSQLNLCEQFQEDACAKRLAWNVLHHTLQSDWDPMAAPLLDDDPTQVVDVKLPPQDKMHYYNMSKFGNRNSKNAPVTGWYSKNGDLDSFSPGKRLFGDVIFRMPRQGATLLLGSTPKQPTTFPKTLELPGHNMRFSEINLLHAASWVDAQPGDEIGRLELIYTDGSTHTFTLRQGVDIADWHNPKSLDNAKLVHQTKNNKGFYLTKLNNPKPDTQIKSLQFSAPNNNAFWIVAGITMIQN